MPKCVNGNVTVSATDAEWRTRRKTITGAWGTWSAWGAIPGAAGFLPFNVGPLTFDTCECPEGETPVLTNCVTLPPITISVPWTTFPVSTILRLVQVQVRVMGNITLNITVCDLECVRRKMGEKEQKKDSGGKPIFYYVTESPDAPPPDVLSDEGIQSDLVAFVKGRLGANLGEIVDEFFTEQSRKDPQPKKDLQEKE